MSKGVKPHRAVYWLSVFHVGMEARMLPVDTPSSSSGAFLFPVQLLLDHGADPNQRDGLGNTPLHLGECLEAAKTGSFDGEPRVLQVPSRLSCPLGRA